MRNENIKFITLAFLLASSLLGCGETSSFMNDNTSISTSLKTTLNVTVKSATRIYTSDGDRLTISLFEYDPMIADRTATLIDKKTHNLSQNDSGKQFIYHTQIGSNAKLNQGSRYYLTAIITNKNKRVYYGYKNGQNGLSCVLEPRQSRDITMILKKVD